MPAVREPLTYQTQIVAKRGDATVGRYTTRGDGGAAIAIARASGDHASVDLAASELTDLAAILAVFDRSPLLREKLLGPLSTPELLDLADLVRESGLSVELTPADDPS